MDSASREGCEISQRILKNYFHSVSTTYVLQLFLVVLVVISVTHLSSRLARVKSNMWLTGNIKQQRDSDRRERMDQPKRQLDRALMFEALTRGLYTLHLKSRFKVQKCRKGSDIFTPYCGLFQFAAVITSSPPPTPSPKDVIGRKVGRKTKNKRSSSSSCEVPVPPS